MAASTRSLDAAGFVATCLAPRRAAARVARLAFGLSTGVSRSRGGPTRSVGQAARWLKISPARSAAPRSVASSRSAAI